MAHDTKKILITGATGLIGSKLVPLLKENGFEVLLLSRQKSNKPNYVFWDIPNGLIESEKLKDIYAVIHLAGSGIADGRWTEIRKKEIISSRVDSAKLLSDTFAKLNSWPQVYITASGVGYYGADSGSQLMTETDNCTNDFVSIVTQKWEAASEVFKQNSCRVVKLRIGIVLSELGGALPKLLLPIKLFVGSPIAPGSQYMSWIHINDLCNLFKECVANDNLEGIYNAVSSEPATNKTFTQKVAHQIKRPLFFPNIPQFVLKLLFGEMSSLLIGGNNVSNKKLLNTGFKFEFDNLETTFKNLLK
jgi:uncharacterized protein